MSGLGEQLRHLSNEETEHRRSVVQSAKQQHAEFWQKWRPFRCTQEGDEHGHAFWHVVHLIDRDIDPDGTRGLFAKFVQLRPGTLVVDVAAGSRSSMLEVLLRNTPHLIGYVAIEPPANGHQIRENFQKAGHGQLFEFVPWDFWEGFPSAQISEISRERGATSIVTMTYWGATYLPKQEIRAWVTAALSMSDAIYINMLSQGKFQPEVLKREYMPLLMKLLLTGKVSIKEAYRALSAVKTMVQFGNEFSQLMPLWTAEELRESLSDICSIGRVRQDVMLGQTTFLELLPPDKHK